MKVKDLLKMSFKDMSVVVSWNYNKGLELDDLRKEQDNPIVQAILNSKVKYFTKTSKYDLVIKCEEIYYCESVYNCESVYKM